MIYLCAISNIRSGACKEDCRFCTQSVKWGADIKRYKQKEIKVKPLDFVTLFYIKIGEVE